MTLLGRMDAPEQNFAEQIFSRLPMGLLIVDARLCIAGMNEWIGRRLPPDIRALEPEGKNLLEVFPDLKNSRLEFALEQALNAGQSGFLSNSLNPHPLPLYENGDRSGERLHQTLNIIPLRGADTNSCVIQIQDVSHAVQREKLLARKAAMARDKELELAAALEIAEEASRAKSRFLAHMSHDIRTPLVSLLGFTEYLLDSELSPDQRTHLEIIRKSGDTLLYLLNDILDFARIEAGKVRIQEESVSLESVLKDAIGPFLNLAAQKQLDLEYHLDPGVPATVLSDSNRLKQILHNLISNAVKFTERGRVRVDIYPDGKSVAFVVEDTGSGVAVDRQDAIFESFTQEDESRVRKFGGSGLGLSIVRSLAEMMGGNISLESPVSQGGSGGPGSRFRVVLPLKKAEEDPSVATPETGKRSFEGKRVLLAEDNPDNALLFERLFRRMSLEFDHASNGRAAVELAKQNQYDLILMDIQMPEMDGYEATRRLRSEGHCGPIIALTANAYKEDRDMALDAGMDDYLAKPISRRTLESALAHWLLNPELHT